MSCGCGYITIECLLKPGQTQKGINFTVCKLYFKFKKESEPLPQTQKLAGNGSQTQTSELKQLYF